MIEKLTHEQILRYSRHLLMPEVGLSGQIKLKNSSALIIGAGGLGSPVALYLAAAGVGRIGLVDYDVVDSSNLQRQIIHGSSAIGKLKVESARDRLADLNPDIQIDIYNEPYTSANALRIAKDYDVIIDGTDNFPTRYLTNDVCVMLGKPNIYGSIFRFDGQVSVFYAKEGPCYRCLFPEPPPPGLVPSCAEGGVLGVFGVSHLTFGAVPKRQGDLPPDIDSLVVVVVQLRSRDAVADEDDWRGDGRLLRECVRNEILLKNVGSTPFV